METQKKYRFKTLEELDRDFMKDTEGNYVTSPGLFSKEMFHLCGELIPSWFADTLNNNDSTIYLDLSYLFPDKDLRYYYHRDMITEIKDDLESSFPEPVFTTKSGIEIYDEPELIVWNGEGSATARRRVIARAFNKWIFISEGSFMNADNAKAIPPTVTVTLKEIAKWKGVNVDQIEIKD